jgi:hypothetical protein
MYFFTAKTKAKLNTSSFDVMDLHLITSLLDFNCCPKNLSKKLLYIRHNYMCFFQPHSIPLVNELTLCSPNMAFTSQCCHCWSNASKFTSPILCNSRICCLQCISSQGKELSQLTPHWSILPFSNWNIRLLTQKCRCVFTWLCQCHLELEKAERPSSFYLGHFSS